MVSNGDKVTAYITEKGGEVKDLTVGGANHVASGKGAKA